MLDPRYQRYADRLGELIEEGKKIATPPDDNSVTYKFQPKDDTRVHRWLMKALNILETAFGSESLQFQRFEEVLQGFWPDGVAHSHELYPMLGALEGAKDDLEQGYLTGQEFLIAGEVFGSLLEQAKHLNALGYKDPAAVLLRVVLEDALKRLARSEGIDDGKKASVINDELKKAGRYPQPRSRLVQACLDVGNDAAHGKFGDYDQEDVKARIADVEQFLAVEFAV